jgi:acyl-CoA thioester hydrolase
VDSQCTFKEPVEFPGTVDAGLRVGKLGNSSVRYEIGLFRDGSAQPAATGRFVHVFVGRSDRRPVPVPDRIRAALEGITG